MQRVNKVKTLLCMLSYHMSYSLNLSVAVTKKLPSPPQGFTLNFIRQCYWGLSPRPKEALTGRAASWNIQSDTLLEAVIGHSLCSYVNEHLVASAGPAAEPGLRLERRSRGSDWVRGRGAQTLDGLSLLFYISPHCHQVLKLLIIVVWSESLVAGVISVRAFSKQGVFGCFLSFGRVRSLSATTASELNLD